MPHSSLSLISLFEQRVNVLGSAPALRSCESGQWTQTSWRAWWEHGERLAAGLIALGVQPSDRVALLARTSEVWAILDVAILMAGAVVVPLYPSSLAAQVQAIVEDAQARVVIVEDPAQAQKLMEPLRRGSIDRLVLIQSSGVSQVQGTSKSVESIHLEDLDVDGSLAEREALLDLDALGIRGRRFIARDPEAVVERGGGAGPPPTLLRRSCTPPAPQESLLACVCHTPRCSQRSRRSTPWTC